MNTKLFCGAALVSLLSAVPALAQSADSGDIVVTGSRIGRSTFTSPNPVTVIGSAEIAKLGQVNIAETIKTIPQNVASISETNTGLSGPTSAYNVGAQVANLRGLNPTNGVRTLTLVDTKRFVPSTTGGAVDLNLIPSLLVKSVETVTGGASAAYGTDALAGVVNVLLDHKLQGFKFQIDSGQTFAGDGADTHMAAAAGFDLFGGRAHTIAGAEYQNTAKVGDCVYVRDWCAKSADTFLNEQFLTNGQPHYVRGINGAYTNYNTTLTLRGSTSGVRVNPTALRNLTFSADGKRVIDFDPGVYTQALGFNDRQGGTCTLDCSPWSEVQLRPEIKRGAFYSHTDFDITKSLKGHFEASYGFRKSDINGLSLGPNSTTVIFADNPYLQGVTYFDRTTNTTRLLTDLLAANSTFTAPTSTQPVTGGVPGGIAFAPGIPSPAIFSAKHFRNVPGGRSGTSTDMDTYRFEGGLEGDFFIKDWKWDAYYQYGKTQQDVVVRNLRVNSFFTYAIDAVRDPVTGNIVCRATLPGPANTFTPPGTFQRWNDPNAAGCVPLNMTGTNTESAAAVAYAYRNSTEHLDYDQQVLAGNLHGDLFEGWAGPISMALGAEYRKESGDTVHNKLPFNGEFSTVAFGADFGGDLEIKEGYLELSAPLAKDLPFAKSIELDGAYRRTGQTNTDHITGKSKDLDVETFKLSGTWDINDIVRLRGTRSQDIRAAGFNDLYYTQGTIPPGPPSGTAINPWIAVPNTNDSAAVTYPPNFALDPEVGFTNTAGFVLQPKGFLDGLRFSADYYDIKILKAIAILTTQQVVDACFTANVGCQNITSVTGATFDTLPAAQRQDIGSIARGSQNVGSFRTSGWDVELGYTSPLDRFEKHLTGDLSIRTIATFVDRMVVNLGNGAGNVDYVGQTGGSAFGGFTAPPRYQLANFFTYDVGGFSATIDTKYIPKSIYDIRRLTGVPNTNNNSINDNSVDSKFYVGLSLSQKFFQTSTHSAEAFLSIRNLFNVDPPNAASDIGGTSGRVSGIGAPTNPVYYDTLGAAWRAGLRLAF